MSYTAKLKVAEHALKHMETTRLGGTSVLAQCVCTTGENEAWAMHRDSCAFRGPKERKFPSVGKEASECPDGTEDDVLQANDKCEAASDLSEEDSSVASRGPLYGMLRIKNNSIT